MAINELARKEAINSISNQALATRSLISPLTLNRTAEAYKKVMENMEGPLRSFNLAVKSLRPQIEAINKMRIPEIPTMLSPLYEQEELSIPATLTRPIQDVRIINAEDIVIPAVKEESNPMSVSHTLPTTKNAIFYLKGNDIYHYKIGRLTYKPRGLNDPKYIKAFKNVIRYMPLDRKIIRIKELESVMDKQDKIGQNYRMNIGKSARSFKGFLIKNGVINSHPVHKEVIIAATDEYITFHNFLESE